MALASGLLAMLLNAQVATARPGDEPKAKANANRPVDEPPGNFRQVEEAEARKLAAEMAGILEPGFSGAPSEAEEISAAGLAPGSKPETLTWERVYTLALIRARSPRAALMERLDPQALTEQARRLGVDSFARFRDEILAGRAEDRAEDGGFRDPSEAFLDLLARRLILDNARKNVAMFERFSEVFRELLEGENSGLTRRQIEEIDAWLDRARGGLVDATEGYRNALDEMKVRLGLSPHAPMILDPIALAGLRYLFMRIDSWAGNPRRTLEQLEGLVERFPVPGDVTFQGRSVLDVVEKQPDREEDLLRAAARLAIENRRKGQRGEVDEGELELRVRRAIRGLDRSHQDYALARRSFRLALLQKDRAQEQLIAPPGETRTSAALNTANLFIGQDRFSHSQDMMVRLWARGQARRLGLYRELGVLPYDDWKSFYAQFEPQVAGERIPETPEEFRKAIRDAAR
jgi:hypothetical protein